METTPSVVTYVLKQFGFLIFQLDEVKVNNLIEQSQNLEHLRFLHSFYFEFNHNNLKDSKPQNIERDFVFKILLHKKLDKILLSKFRKFNVLTGIDNILGPKSLANKTTHQDETTKLHSTGVITQKITNVAAYSDVVLQLNKYIEDKFIVKEKIKAFIMSFIKGNIDLEILNDNKCQDKEIKIFFLEQLNSLILLMFNLEVKRNSACFLTNCMLFELIDAGIYKVEQISQDYPMAMDGAVESSIHIDHEFEFKYFQSYDQRKPTNTNPKDLEIRHRKILTDWIIYKIGCYNDLSGNKITFKSLDSKFKQVQVDETTMKLIFDGTEFIVENVKIDEAFSAKNITLYSFDTKWLCTLIQEWFDKDISKLVEGCQNECISSTKIKLDLPELSSLKKSTKLARSRSTSRSSSRSRSRTKSTSPSTSSVKRTKSEQIN